MNLHFFDVFRSLFIAYMFFTRSNPKYKGKVKFKVETKIATHISFTSANPIKNVIFFNPI